MRTVSSRLAFLLVAVVALVAVGAAGGASKAGPTFVIAGASDPTYRCALRGVPRCPILP